VSRRNRSEAVANRELAMRPLPVPVRRPPAKPPTAWQRVRALARRLGFGVHRGGI